MSDKLNSISNELLNKNLKACSNEECYEAVSYTHLDVYKRQSIILMDIMIA